ncbi:hypothetical protein [Meiothermus granaticius]|uniref:hypothetical protein n=1 Tax=Meiothermus granaticius TaxID=863370 RepID=UPI001191202C|nr:hypothetical protein [Meiothermus granaticius]GEM86400.1 hypothetical protein MGR01S_10250 [Meiothermus granaticius NBRC 107808]
MRGLRAVLYILLMALGGLAWAQARTDLQGIVPGNELGWEIQELRASVVVSKPTLLNLQIYSPGFDPQDYRRGLKGQPELGDERYDGGKGSLLSEFTLQQDRKVLAQATYGVEPHRWVVFFRGALQPGIYQLTSRFIGLGKNAFRYRLQTSVPGAAELLVDPTLQLYDIRRPGGVLLANVRGGNWLEPFVLEVSSQVLPLKVGFYDEDGPKELEARVRLPNGSIQPRSVSGDKAWAYYQVSQPGVFRFGFRQPPSAQQYSNTIGFRVDACMEVGRDRFKVVPPRPITALAVDPAGKALEVPLHLEGQAPRTVRLDSVPAGYRFVRLETEGGVVSGPRAVEFGCAGGSVRFVLEKTPPPEHELSLSALLVTPQGEQPFEMAVRVEDQTVRLKEGAAQIRLAQAEPTILAQIPGARVERQERYREEGGGAAHRRGAAAGVSRGWAEPQLQHPRAQSGRGGHPHPERPHRVPGLLARRAEPRAAPVLGTAGYPPAHHPGLGEPPWNPIGAGQGNLPGRVHPHRPPPALAAGCTNLPAGAPSRNLHPAQGSPTAPGKRRGAGPVPHHRAKHRG